MNRRRAWLTTVALIIVAAPILVSVFASSAQAREHMALGQTHGVRVRFVRRANTDPFQSITSYQLDAMHLFLGPAPQSVPVSANAAVQAVQTFGMPDGGGPVIEEALGTCSMTPAPVSDPLAWAERPCWVVVVKPGVSPSQSAGGAEVGSVPFTVEFALVDAETGEIFDIAASNPPATPTAG
ncbi:MAG TPA: hypothetical protein VKR79_08240 [Gaiellaceae bacterium]|nr:hypothetical protein [Gaiellaceae bacterium]